MLKRIAVALVVVLALAGGGFVYLESDPESPTPSEEADVPSFIGAPAVAKPIAAALAGPVVQHPYLARSGLDSMHNDAAQSDVYRWSGPLGVSPSVETRQFHRLGGSCVSQSFDRAGRMLGTCVGPFGVTLVARDPDSLDVLARRKITAWLPFGAKFSGGVYFHLDHEDKILLATNAPAIERWGLEGSGGDLAWERVEQIDIASFLDSAAPGPHRVVDVLPDWRGDYWFITRGGVVGVVDRSGENGHAVAWRRTGAPTSA